METYLLMYLLNKIIKLYPFCRLKGLANLLIMFGPHFAAISIHLLNAFRINYPVQIFTMGGSASDILKISRFTATRIKA